MNRTVVLLMLSALNNSDIVPTAQTLTNWSMKYFLKLACRPDLTGIAYWDGVFEMNLDITDQEAYKSHTSFIGFLGKSSL